MKAPQLRTGSAVWLALLRKVTVVLRRPQEQFVPDAVAQFVLRIGGGKIGRGVAPRAALDRDHVEAGIGQFVGEMEPVQPRPMMTTSLRGSLRAMFVLAAMNSNQNCGVRRDYENLIVTSSGDRRCRRAAT